MRTKENFSKLAAVTTHSSAMYRALLKAARELLPPAKHAELALLSKKYLPEELADEEIKLEDLDPRIGAVISSLLDRKD